MTTLNDVLPRLEGVRKNGVGYMACCPVHDDHDPSLKVWTDDQDRLAWHCFAGCDHGAVGRALGVENSHGVGETPVSRETPQEICRTEGAVFGIGRVTGKYTDPERERADRVGFLRDDYGDEAEAWFDAGVKEVCARSLLTCLSDVEPLRVEWLWPRRIPMGMITVIFGDAGLGKSHVWQDIVTRISTGAVWPDGGRAPLGNSVILSAEDDVSRVIVPRLAYSGADPSRAFCMASVTDFDDHGRRTFSLIRDVARLEAAIVSVSATLAVVDPLTAYLDGIDSHVTTDVRSALVKLSDVAERTGAAVLCIMHPNKDMGRGTKALYRLAGSGAFGAAPRSVMLVSEDEARKDESRRLLLPVKLNVAAMPGGLGFRVVSSSPDTCESGIHWDTDPVEVDADGALGCGRADSSANERATEFLRAALADGDWHPAGDLYAAAAEQGIHEKALQRARKRIGATYRKDKFGGPFAWRLNSEGS